nr:BTB/POZ and MATH domain-containing protein 3-like [Aegilops tauschii subsp. strangulata]
MRGAGRQQITASSLRARQATGSHVFTIHEFTKVREKVANGTAVLSSPFRVGGHDWRIKCYPNGETEKAEGHISLFLNHGSHGKTGDAMTKFKISVLDKAWKPSYTETGKERCFTGGGWGWNKFMKHEDLDKEKHLKDDCLSVLCDVTIDLGLRADDYTDEAAAVDGHKSAPPHSPPFDLRGVALAEALWNTRAADLMIHLGDGQTIPAHRWVLEARSPVFKADLAHASTTGENIAELRVDGMDAEVCKELLQFIYTDSPPQQIEVAVVEGLLAAADRYELEKLKLVCEEALCKIIDTRSVAATLALAERHRCPALREACMQFLSSPGNLKAVMASDGFEQLKTGCPSALLELLVKNMLTHEQQISTSSQIDSYSNRTK